MAERADVIQRVIAFWFADPGAPGPGQTRPIWFEEDPAFDEEVRARFTRDLERAAAGELDRLTATPEGCLALVILIDQFPRNMFRGTPSGATKIPLGQPTDSIVALTTPARDFFNSLKLIPVPLWDWPLIRRIPKLI